MKKVLRVLGIIVLIIIVLIAVIIGVLYYGIYYGLSAPKDYTKKVVTGGDIEAKYLETGKYKTKSYTEDTAKPIDKFLFYYPEELENSNKKYPVIVVVNGTGVFANKSKYFLRHLASWGFIVLDNYDPGTYNGETANQTLNHLASLNKDKNSIFYNKADLDNVGITGHSQGGVGIFNATQAAGYDNTYKCAVSISPTDEELANKIGMKYTSSEITVPVLLLAGTENDVISAGNLEVMYNNLNVSKAMAVKTGTNHGEMFYCADGYATAWFMWHLQNDSDAGKAFTGSKPELISNKLYQNQHIDLE